MTDWKNKADYAYTKSLGDLGWAWEFIRRNRHYRTTFNRVRLIIERLYDGDWSKQEMEYFPRRRQFETEQAWSYRIDDRGLRPKLTTLSCYCAGKWSLKNLYDYRITYSADQIRFRFKRLERPTFYSRLFEESTIIGKLSKGNPQYLPKMRPLEDFDLDSGGREEILYLALDASRNIDRQIAEISDFVNRYRTIVLKGGRSRHKIYEDYIRYLDARDAGETNNSKILRIIERDYDGLPFEVAKRASKKMKAAERMRQGGYRKLLM